MVKYNINLIFKENGKSLNEILTNALQMKLENHSYILDNISNKEVPLNTTHYFQSERIMN